ncbi:MAG: hypothetical protein AABX07_05385 [Nanoarchaeota archaeon]
MTKVYYRVADTPGCGCDPTCKQTRVNALYGDVLRAGYHLGTHVSLEDTKEEVQRHLDEGRDVIVGLTPVLCENLGDVKMRVIFLREKNPENTAPESFRDT